MSFNLLNTAINLNYTLNSNSYRTVNKPRLSYKKLVNFLWENVSSLYLAPYKTISARCRHNVESFEC